MKLVLMNPHYVKKSKELDDHDLTKNDRKGQKVIVGLIRDDILYCTLRMTILK